MFQIKTKKIKFQKNYLSFLILLLLISCKEKEEVPVVIADSVSYITHNSAIFYLKIASHGTGYAMDAGVCWSTLPNPTLSDSFSAGKGLLYGIFGGCALTGLLPNTTYYLRAWAESTVGVGYSNNLEMTTKNVDVFVDIRDGQQYQYIEYIDMVWMVENLNFKTNHGSLYYDNDSLSYAGTYGRLYSWQAACNACPDGWHLPSDDEWMDFELYWGLRTEKNEDYQYGNTDALREPGYSHWLGDNQDSVTNESGFTVLPAGAYNEDDSTFVGLGKTALFWTSSKNENDEIWIRRMLYSFDRRMNRRSVDITPTQSYYSVRCVKD